MKIHWRFLSNNVAWTIEKDARARLIDFVVTDDSLACRT